MILGLYHRLHHICCMLKSHGVECIIYSFVFAPALVYAQQGNDSIAEGSPIAAVPVSSAQQDKEVKCRTVSFQPGDVQLQKRYTPRENDTLFTSQWWRRMYAGVGGGVQGLSDNVGGLVHGSLNAYLGYRISPIHSLRVHGSLISYSYDMGRKTTRSLGVGADYLANLSNFAWGYNRDRMIDVSTLLGAGIRVNGTGLPGKLNPYAHLGLHADLHLSSNFSLFLEPYIGVQRSMDALFGRSNPEKWNLMYGVSGGIQASLSKRIDHYTEADSIYRKFFFDSGIGAVASGTDGGLMHRMGVVYHGALGMWLNPMLGLRIGAQAQSAYWDSEMVTMRGVPIRRSKEHVVFSGRAEILVNPMNFFKKWRNREEGHDFDLNVLLGGDYGWNMKSHMENTTSGGFQVYYYGLTGALQALYRIAKPGTFIFVEPRYLAIMYNVPYRNTYNSLFTVEHNVSLNIGTRVYMTNPTITGKGKDEFVPRWWVAADVGGVKWQRGVVNTTGGLGIHPSVGISMGYDWKRMASFRAQLQYQRMYDTSVSSYSGYDNTARKTGSGLWNSSFDAMDFRLSYMLNLNNLLQGYSKDRRFNLWWTVGPTLGCFFNETHTWVEGQDGKAPKLSLLTLGCKKFGNISPGISSSLMAALRVAPQYDVTVEALGQYNFIAGTNPGNRALLNNIKYGLTMGTRYHFEPDQVPAYACSDNDKFFFDSNVSWATSSLSNAFRLGGTQYNVALGMWFNPILGVRLAGNVQSMKHQSYVKTVYDADVRYSKGLASCGIRAELMLNPLNFFGKWRNREGGNDFELNLLAGLEHGAMVKAKQTEKRNLVEPYYGVTGAMQFLYRINNPGTYIFVEPRFLTSYYRVPYLNTGIEKMTRDNMFALGVGTRVYFTDLSFSPANSREMIPHWWTGLDFGGAKIQKTTALSNPEGIGFNPALTLSVGYDWKPLVSFRAQVAYQRIGEYAASSYSGLNGKGQVVSGYGLWNNGYNIMDLRLGYMLNVNNFLQGYDSKRKFNLWLTASPAMSWIISESNEWIEGQKGTFVPLDRMHLKNFKEGFVSPAVAASLMATLNVAKDVDVSAEVLGQYNFIEGSSPGGSGIINNLKYNLAVGARYHFKPENIQQFYGDFGSKPWQRGWYIDASYGWSVPLETGLGLHGSGSNLYLSLGYWFNSLFGARLALGGQQMFWSKSEVPAVIEPVSGMQVHGAYTKYKSQMMMGGRAEIVLSPLNLIRSRRESDTGPRWDMNLSLGMNFGGMAKLHGPNGGYIGFTGSLSGLYRLSNTTQLFVEPRYDVFNFSVYNNALKFNEVFSDRMFTVSVGTRIARPAAETKEEKRPVETEDMAHRGWWSGVSIGGAKMTQCLRIGTDGISVQPSVGLTGGYDFNRLHGLRAHLCYDVQFRKRPGQPYSVESMGMTRNYKGTVNSTYHQMDIRLLYMLNVTNFWTGYDKRNALDMYLEFGPAFSTIMGESNTLADGELMGGTNFRYTGNDYSGGTSMGLVAGCMMALKLHQHWDLTAEVMGQFYFGRKYMPEEYHKFLNGVKINFGIGTRYNF